MKQTQSCGRGITLTPEELEFLQALAEEWGVSVNWTIRFAIRRLKREEEKLGSEQFVSTAD